MPKTAKLFKIAPTDFIPNPIYCTRCGELLKGRVVWLSLNCSTGRYSVEPVEDPEQDQGAHPFGVACSRRALKAEGR